MASIKISYNGSIRKINVCTSSWLELESEIRRVHSIPASSRLLVTYIDEDNDLISIDRDDELSDFVKNNSKVGKSGKLHVTIPDGDQDSFEIITRKEVNGADGDSASIKTLLPPYSESSTVLVAPVMEVDSADTASVHSTEEKGKAPLYPSIDVAEEAIKLEYAKQEEARKLAEEVARKKVEEEERIRREDEDRTRQAAEEADAKRRAEDAEAAYRAFLAEVQPLIYQLISTLEANPQYMGRLLTEYSSTLSQRVFGLLFSGPGLNGVSTGVHTCSARRHGCGTHRSQGPYGRFDYRGRSHGVSEKGANKLTAWSTVTCDSCEKSGFEGERYVCIKCEDYDLCGECYLRHSEVHDPTHTFEKLTDPNLRWNGVSCDGCKRRNFPGNRYVCLTCPDFDLCTRCHEKTSAIHSIDHEFEKLGDPAARHFLVSCDGCNTKGFGGPRFKCTNCPDFDLCVRCFHKGAAHSEGHKFRKIEIVVSRGEHLLDLPTAAPSPSVNVNVTSSVSSTTGATTSVTGERATFTPVAEEAQGDPRVEYLINMGFGSDRKILAELLCRYGSVESVVGILLLRA